MGATGELQYKRKGVLELFIVLWEISRGVDDGDEGILPWTLGVVTFLFNWKVCMSILLVKILALT